VPAAFRLHEAERFGRTGRVFSVLLADIDYFKRINDEHGHACGDAVLSHLAGRYLRTLRRQDGVARWGGEEFLFLLPETNLAGAERGGDNLRSIVEGLELPWDGGEVSVPMTVGISVYGEASDLERCLQEADLALCRGKKGGRNRVSS